MKIQSLKLLVCAVLAASAIVLAASCTMKKPQTVTQGISGYIYELTGNQMPMKGKNAAKPKGIKAEVWIYEATTMAQTTGSTPAFNKVNTRLAAKVTTDTAGHYQAALPAGTYSVFIKQGNQFFAAETDGNILNPVTVKPGMVAQRNVTVTLGAAF